MIMVRSRQWVVLALLLLGVLVGAVACGDATGVVEQAGETGEAVIAGQLTAAPEPTAAAVEEEAEEPVEEEAEEPAEGAAEEAAGAEPAEGVHWSYEGATGPDHWVEINAACGGSRQSPIDVTGASPSDLVDIVFNYGESAVNIFNNGHTIQVNYDQGSTIVVDGTTLDLWQFHFHAPSEHAVDGVQADAEMHLVHRLGEDVKAVIGVLINEGEENPAFASVWANLPAEVSAEAQTVEGAFVNAEALLPEARTYYAYPGSLTTPPCTEEILWLLLTTPIEMSAQQLADFSAIVAANNRPVQPLNDRELVVDTTSN
jgi:carbonic anhydrase